MLCNSEAGYNIKLAEYDYLETIDVQLMRKILNAPQATPKEMLYLELGCVPFRFMIQKRRLLYLHYLLNENPGSMVNKFLMTQFNKKNKKDWTSTVLRDIEELKLNMSIE